MKLLIIVAILLHLGRMNKHLIPIIFQLKTTKLQLITIVSFPAQEKSELESYP